MFDLEVSGDRLVDQQTGNAYCIVHIDVAEEVLGAANLRLQAGMPVVLRCTAASTDRKLPRHAQIPSAHGNLGARAVGRGSGAPGVGY